MYQMKEQDKTPEKQHWSGDRQPSRKRIQIMIVKMIQNLGKRMQGKIENMQEMFNKDLEKLKNT